MAPRPRSRSGAAALALASLLAPGGPVGGQEAGGGLSVQVRGGLAFSTALAEDAVAAPSMMRELLAGTALPERLAGPVRLALPPAPMVAVAVSTRLAPRWTGEVEGAWTFARLQADDGLSTWEMERMDVAHAALGARFYPRDLYYLRGGLGVIRYSGEGYGIFREGAELSQMLQAGLGTERAFERFRIAVDVTGQAHRFSTVPLREAGGQDGTVYRGVLQVGVGFGGGSP